MKKVISMAMLTIFICCILCGCGKSEAVKNVEALIDGISEVTLESEESIKTAEEAYNALTDKEKAKVENADQLVSKREELDACIARAEEEKVEKLKPFMGDWKEFTLNYTKRKFTVDETTSISGDGDYILGIKGVPGPLRLMDDNGITKLVSNKGVFVREEEYEDAMDKVYAHVVLDENNISDYIGGPVEIGKLLDQWGEESDIKVYILSSPAYNDDLVLFDYKDVQYDVYYKGYSNPSTYSYPYPLLASWSNDIADLDHFGRAEGELWYVRKDFISEIRELSGTIWPSREIIFTDGTTYTQEVPNPEHITASISDYEF